jgi:hypothetical protein
MDERKTASNKNFASDGDTCKLGALRMYSSIVRVDREVFRNRQLFVAANRNAPL